jgi:hypothetical protein
MSSYCPSTFSVLRSFLERDRSKRTVAYTRDLCRQRTPRSAVDRCLVSPSRNRVLCANSEDILISMFRGKFTLTLRVLSAKPMSIPSSVTPVLRSKFITTLVFVSPISRSMPSTASRSRYCSSLLASVI